MRHRPLGSSDLQVSEISRGSWLTYSGGVEADATAACTRAAFDAGITFFDTANVYGHGAAEEAWGPHPRRLPAHGRHPRHQGLLPDVRHRPGALGRPDRQADRRRAPTTSTSTSATASTPRCRSRRRWRPWPRSCARARPATSGSANGLRSRRDGPGLGPAPPGGGVGDHRRAGRPEQVHANAAAAGIELTADTLAAIDDALGDVPVTGPQLAPGASPGITHR